MSVKDGSKAQKAGFEQGDIIIGVEQEENQKFAAFKPNFKAKPLKKFYENLGVSKRLRSTFGAEMTKFHTKKKT